MGQKHFVAKYGPKKGKTVSRLDVFLITFNHDMITDISLIQSKFLLK